MSDSSRDTAEGAGWGTDERGAYQRLMPSKAEKISWLDPKMLWAARNGVLASWFGDPTGRTRGRWVAQRAAAGAPADKVIRRDDPDRFSFLVIGDTGEGDDPQYAVVPGFLKTGQDTSFAVLASDVIYPVGSADDYGTKFFRPYRTTGRRSTRYPATTTGTRTSAASCASSATTPRHCRPNPGRAP
ncbi:hypothetical protein SVIOM74S_00796 [Streptomyces violarus]